MSQIIPTGPYFGFTLAELRVELIRYKSARQQSSSRIASASVNGQAFAFGDRKDATIDEWQANLQAALHYLDPSHYPYTAPSDRSAVRFC